MLRSEHSIVAFENGLAMPDRLTRQRHAQYVTHAERMLAVYRSGVGTTRRELHHSIRNLLAGEADCDHRRIAAFCKLLDDRAEFEKDRRGRAAELRLRIFSSAAKYHPLVSRPQHLLERAEHEVKNLLAAEVGMAWPQIDAALYADVIDFQPLKKFDGYADGPALLAGYNIAQLQASLYRAESMAVTASRDFKTILRYVKLARLLHEIRRLGPEQYRIDLAGPTAVLSSSRRYGVSFARFVPALLACEGWTMTASIRAPWGNTARLVCDSKEGLCSPMPPPEEFDSCVEEDFATAFGAERDGWRLIREGVILYEGQTTFVPDFVFRHADGREALMEIVGFWTPEYLEKKRQTLRRFQRHKVLLAVAERFLRKAEALPDGVMGYGKAIPVESVLAMLRQR